MGGTISPRRGGFGGVHPSTGSIPAPHDPTDHVPAPALDERAISHYTYVNR